MARANTFRYKSDAQFLREKNSSVAFLVSENERFSFRDELSFVSDNSNAFALIRLKLLPITDSLPLMLYNLDAILRVLWEGLDDDCPIACMKLLVGVANEVRGEMLDGFLAEILPRMVKLVE
jgi:hypothetical protein